ALEDVRSGALVRIQGLRQVANRREVAMAFGDAPQQVVLRRRDVLQLVGEDVPKGVAIQLYRLRLAAEQPQRQHQHRREVDRTAAAKPAFVLAHQRTSQGDVETRAAVEAKAIHLLRQLGQGDALQIDAGVQRALPQDLSRLVLI